jgi:hypothetical protein
MAELRGLDLVARLGSHRSRGAHWADAQPIILASDFDFALAVAVEGAGAGLAAGRRSHVNAEAAARLAAVEPIRPLDIASLLATQLGQRCHGVLAGRSVRVYGTLYGARRARLTTVVEVAGAGGQLEQHLSVGAAFEAGVFSHPGLLRQELELGIVHVARSGWAVGAPATAPGLNAEGQCSLGDRATMRGRVVSTQADAVVLDIPRAPFATHVRCPLEAFTRMPLPEASPAALAPEGNNLPAP